MPKTLQISITVPNNTPTAILEERVDALKEELEDDGQGWVLTAHAVREATKAEIAKFAAGGDDDDDEE